MTTRAKVILGIVGAAAAGVAIGMLMAPEKGSDVRRRISQTAGGWTDQLSGLLDNAKGQLKNMRGKAKTSAGSESFS